MSEHNSDASSYGRITCYWVAWVVTLLGVANLFGNLTREINGFLKSSK